MSTRTLDTRLSMQVLLGVTGVKGEDLFSFQPIGGPKLGGHREDFFFQFSMFPNVFPQCSPSSQCVPQHVLHI